MKLFVMAAKSAMRRTLLRGALRVIKTPLRLASALTWWLQGIQARLQTALANEEAKR